MDFDVVHVMDTTLRDGEQTPGVSFALADKLVIARELIALNVDVIEAGFAGASPGDFECVRAVSALEDAPIVCSLARCVPADVDAALKALDGAKHPRVHVVIATSDLHLRDKLRMSRQEALERAVDCVRLARAHVDDVEFSCEDASRSDPEYLVRITRAAAEAGATVINIPDTVGYAAPDEFEALVRRVRGAADPKVLISVHCHNDLGQAVAVSLAGVRGGARQVEVTLCGLGERAGNAALEEIVMALRTRQAYYGADTRVQTSRLYHACRRASALSGIDLSANKPIVGASVFTHQSGIHQDGVLKNRETYEIMRPEDVGVPMGGMTLSKLSGSHALRERAEQLGFTLDDAGLADAFERFKQLADRKKQVSDQDITAILKQNAMCQDIGEYGYEAYQLLSGNRLTATATLTLKTRAGALVTRAACGDGPVEACFNALSDMFQMDFKLLSYALKAVTEGRDALGEVTVRVCAGDHIALGKGVSTDVIEASCIAYVHAANRLSAMSAQENSKKR